MGKRRVIHVPVDDVECELSEFDTKDLIEELRDRARAGDDEASTFLGHETVSEPLSTAGLLSRRGWKPPLSLVMASPAMGEAAIKAATKIARGDA